MNKENVKKNVLDFEKKDRMSAFFNTKFTKFQRHSQGEPVKKILILSSSPITLDRLRFDEEIREIKERLRLSKYRDNFKIEFGTAVRFLDIRRMLLDFEPQIVHFIGHGNIEGLRLEDEQGRETLISTVSLSELFKFFSAQIECVILSSCYSEAQAIAINQHIQHVIGMSDKIMDKAAIAFSVGFFDALGAGKSIEKAFAFGRNAIHQKYPNFPAHLIPVHKIKCKNF